MIKSFFSALLVLSTVAVSQVSPVSAQVSIEPLLQVKEIKQGKASGIITVKNSSSRQFRGRVYAQPFTVSDTEGLVLEEKNSSDLTPYMIYAPRELVVPPQSTRRVRYIIRIPPDVSSKELRSMIFTENLSEAPQSASENNQNFKVEVTSRIGTAIFVRTGELSTDLNVEFSKYDSQDNMLSILMKNSGTATILPEVQWELKSDGKTLYAAGESRNPKLTILGESERHLHIDLKSLVQNNPVSSSDESVLVVNNQSKLEPGVYELTGKASWTDLDERKSTDFNLEITVP